MLTNRLINSWGIAAGIARELCRMMAKKNQYRLLSDPSVKPVNPTILGAIARQLVTHGHLRDPRADRFDAELTDLVRPRYLDLLPARAATVRDTLDLPDLIRAAGTLASASAQFGYPGLADLCRILQQEARAGKRDPELIEVVMTAAEHIHKTSR